MATPEEKTKETLLRFASSELTSHASNIIGFTILLFTYLNVATNRFERLVFVLPESINLSDVKFGIFYVFLYLIFWVLNSGVFFCTMRLIYYGKYGNAIIHSKKRLKTIAGLNQAVGQRYWS